VPGVLAEARTVIGFGFLDRWLERRYKNRMEDRLLQLEKVRMEIIDDKLDAEVVFGGPAAKVFAAFAIQWFKKTGGNNYVTCDITDSSDGTAYTLTMQRCWGKSPAQEIGELRAKLAESPK
jgi:hypothetical protein